MIILGIDPAIRPNVGLGIRRCRRRRRSLAALESMTLDSPALCAGMPLENLISEALS